MEVVVTIAEFKHHLTARGYAPATIDIYRKNLDQFTAYLESIKVKDIRAVTRQVILDYQTHVMAQAVAMGRPGP
ncbi:MAG: site-specific integrase [Thermodesulfobacteriota bacterium]|nr:site-specific integrase [Thermodesulfobacteriota bacterium]